MHAKCSMKFFNEVSRRGKQAATSDATPSRVRGRDEGFSANRFDHQLHFDCWKWLENWDIVHERFVRLDGDERRVFQELILGLGWGFMYEHLICINVSMVREFCANFSSAKQDHVFLRGKRIPFTEADILRYLNILEEEPDADQDDDFVALVKAYERGDDMNMAEIYSVIGREETNWANDPANNTIPKSINNGILNPRAARHELPEFPNDKFYTVRPVDMYVPYGDWRGERARAPARQRRQPPPQDQPADQLP
ncbi:hypothetical protein PIB30_057220 [Stylosanthes scabra]|uniref:Uncharacterized protein n=1 Tax=Stylosanthes scabra TaxID=79078 RepID=A0ABU6ZIA1_9FABA|nr:hypothetical protein [Stylosanthes scabra]